MKNVSTYLLLLACALGGTAWATAQETPPSPPEVPASASSETPAVPPAPTSVPAVEAPTPSDVRPDAAVEAAEAVERPLRDLTASAPVEAPAAPTVPAAPPAHTPANPAQHRPRGHEVVSVGGAHLPAGETAEAVVAIMGDAHAEGLVRGAVVAVMGDAHAEQHVGDAVVAVLGNARADAGAGNTVVAVMGDVTVNGPVGEVVAVLGTVHLGPKAVVSREVVSVGGRVTRDPGAVVNGKINEIAFFENVPALRSLATWFHEAPMKARLLAFHPDLVWTWGVAAAFLAFYLLLALAAGPAVTRCAETLEQRPGRTLLAAFLSMIVSPPLLVLLSFTFVGALAFFVALLVGLLFGKAAFLAFIGRRITRPLGISHAAVAVLIGGVLMMLLYAVPILGMLLWKIGGMIGLGMVVYTLILNSRRERPALATAGITPAGVPVAAIVAPAAPSGGVATTASAAAVVPGGEVNAALPPVGTVSMGVPPLDPAVGVQAPGAATAAGATAAAAAASLPPPPAIPRPLVVPISPMTLPRAGFWIRLAAALIDVVLVGAIGGMIGLGEYFLILLTAYCVTLWTLKGTTIGGIICGLKVVRLDERKIDWTVALVRSLSAFLSMALAGVGFIWVAFDPEKQSWHDKIAGTTIVRWPRGVSLV
jgi:uncharacterized RDD family membrane protein YckC